MDLLNYIDNFKDDNKVKAQWRVHDNKFIVATWLARLVRNHVQKLRGQRAEESLRFVLPTWNLRAEHAYRSWGKSNQYIYIYTVKSLSQGRFSKLTTNPFPFSYRTDTVFPKAVQRHERSRNGRCSKTKERPTSQWIVAPWLIKGFKTKKPSSPLPVRLNQNGLPEDPLRNGFDEKAEHLKVQIGKFTLPKIIFQVFLVSLERCWYQRFRAHHFSATVTYFYYGHVVSTQRLRRANDNGQPWVSHEGKMIPWFL